MKFVITAHLFILFLCLNSCGSQKEGVKKINPEFETLAYSQLNYNQLQFAKNVSYWSLWKSSGGSSKLVNEGGSCDEKPLSECRKRVMKLSPEKGFGQNCPPAYCYQYLGIISKDEVNLITEANELPTYFEKVDEIREAAFIVEAYGYNFNANSGKIQYFKTNNSITIKAYKLVKFCEPIQTNEFLLKVNSRGELDIIEEKLFESHEGCI